MARGWMGDTGSNPYDADDGAEWYDYLEAERITGEALANCGYVPDVGLCTKAGSEHCDFDCPFSDEVHGYE